MEGVSAAHTPRDRGDEMFSFSPLHAGSLAPLLWARRMCPGSVLQKISCWPKRRERTAPGHWEPLNGGRPTSSLNWREAAAKPVSPGSLAGKKVHSCPATPRQHTAGFTFTLVPGQSDSSSRRTGARKHYGAILAQHRSPAQAASGHWIEVHVDFPPTLLLALVPREQTDRICHRTEPLS